MDISGLSAVRMQYYSVLCSSLSSVLVPRLYLSEIRTFPNTNPTEQILIQPSVRLWFLRSNFAWRIRRSGLVLPMPRKGETDVHSRYVPISSRLFRSADPE